MKRRPKQAAAAKTAKAPSNLYGLLESLAEAGRGQKETSVRDLRDEIGRRSFGPLLLATSLIGFTPVGAIPGVPTTLAVFIGLIAAQMIAGLNSVWLPQFLLSRKVDSRKLERAATSLQPIARSIDKVICPRLTFLTERPSSYVIALVCILIALTVPPLEVVPFVDLPLWAALAAFSLALVTHDGVLAIAAFVLTAAGVTLVAIALL